MTSEAAIFATGSTTGEEGIGAVASTACACTSAMHLCWWLPSAHKLWFTICSLQIGVFQRQWCMRRGLLWLRHLVLRQHIRWMPQRRDHLPRLPVL